MSSFYTTKSLGKNWLPSPGRESRHVSSASRYGSYSAVDSPKLRSSQSYVTPSTWSSSSSRHAYAWSKWSKPYERIALAIALIFGIYLFHTPLQQRAQNFRHNVFAFTHGSALLQPSSIPPTTDPTWSHFAYSFFAHDATSLCSAVVHLQTLQRAHSKPTRLLSYPALWTSSSAPLQDSIARLLQRAELEYGATLQPVSTPPFIGNSAAATEYGKLLAFDQTRFLRVASVDTISSTLLKPLDEIFTFPETDIAMPRAYWNLQVPNAVSDLILLIKPDAQTFERLASRFSAELESTSDMLQQQDQDQDPAHPAVTFLSTLHKLFEEATFLPHRDFLLRMEEFQQMDHSAYLDSFDAVWDAQRVIEDAKVVVFPERQQQQAVAPDCTGSTAQGRTRDGVATCAEREIWEWLRRHRRDQRMAVCGAWASEQDEGGVGVAREAVSSFDQTEQNKITADQEETVRLLAQDMPEVQAG